MSSGSKRTHAEKGVFDKASELMDLFHESANTRMVLNRRTLESLEHGDPLEEDEQEQLRKKPVKEITVGGDAFSRYSGAFHKLFNLCNIGREILIGNPSYSQPDTLGFDRTTHSLAFTDKSRPSASDEEKNLERNITLAVFDVALSRIKKLTLTGFSNPAAYAPGDIPELPDEAVEAHNNCNTPRDSAESDGEPVGQLQRLVTRVRAGGEINESTPILFCHKHIENIEQFFSKKPKIRTAALDEIADSLEEFYHKMAELHGFNNIKHLVHITHDEDAHSLDIYIRPELLQALSRAEDVRSARSV